MMRFLILIVLSASMFTIPAYSQMEEWKVDNLSTNDGMPTDNILYTYQDSFGFLWMATYEGLIRWDGANYKRFVYSQTDSTSLSGNIVYKITEDHKKRLWVGTIDGLNLFDREHERFIRCDIGKETTKIPVNDIREDSQHRLWLGTSYGLCEYNHDSRSAEWYVNDPGNVNTLSHDVIFRLTLDRKGDLWIATFGGGVTRFSPVTGVFTRFLHKERDPSTICSNKIKSILADEEGNIWVGSFDKGVTLLDGSGKVLRQYDYLDPARGRRIQGDVTCIYEDANHTIWLGIKGQIVQYKTKDSNEFRPFENAPYKSPSLHCVSITAMCEDTFGNLFFASQSHGLFRTNAHKNLFRHFYKRGGEEPVLNHNVVTSLHEDRRGNIWIATDGGGLTRLNPAKNEFRSYTTANGLSSDAIMEVRQDDAGDLWLATWSGGVMKFNPATGNVKTFLNDPTNVNSVALNNVKSILPHDTLVWIGTHGQGLSVYDRKNKRFINQRNNHIFPFNLQAPAWINHLFIDSRDRLWISTYGGLYLYEKEQLLHFSPSASPSSISSDFVNMVAEAPDKSIWIASESGGLDRFDENTHSFVRYTDEYDLPRTIKGITFDHNGTMWLSSNEGLSGFDLRTKEIIHYDQADGLQGNSFFHKSILTSSDGLLYIGGPNGINAFNPDSIRGKRGDLKSEVYLTDLYIYDDVQTQEKGGPLRKVLSFTDTLILKPEQSFFSIGYASLNLYSTSKTQFAYKLEGLHDNWINTGLETKASFTQLTPGAYVFRLRYTDVDGRWHEAAKTLRIVVLPPWWQTWWFRSLMVVGAVSLIIVIFYLRISSVKKRNKTLQEEVARRTMELSEANAYLVEKNEEIKLQNEKLEEYNQEILRQSEKILVQQEQNIEQNQQLEKTVRELHRSNQTKDRFFSILAHDLRNPVSTLSGLAESLKNNLRQLSKNDIGEYVESIHRSSQSVYTLLINLLSWARTQSRDIQCSPVDFDIASVVRKNIALMEQEVLNKNIRLSFSSQATHKVFADYNMIDTVIRNLLMNSVKFTHAGGSVEIFCEETDRETVLRVRDTGIGMTPEQLKDLFRIERKSLAVGTAGETGTGLGLVITKEFVEANKGVLKLTSSRGIGSEFFVHLPKSMVTIDRPLTADTLDAGCVRKAHVLDLPLEKLLKLKGKRLLIVDDNKELRYHLRRDLSATFEIFEAENGSDGLKVALEVQPAIIITDMVMPVMDGEKFCKEIKTLPATSHIPVVLLTNQTYDEGQMIGYGAGADVYLTKPVSKELLFQVIYNFVRAQEKIHQQLLKSNNYFPDDVSISKVDEEFLQQVVGIIEKNLSDPELDHKLLCEETALSRTVLYAKTKALTGLGVNEFIRSIRLKKSLSLLRTGKLNVSQVAYEVGFNSQSYFNKCFIRQYNISPKDYGKNPSKLSEANV